ncbi:uncharacterized protein LOC6614390 [Drosophila sechellia]|uniref:GD21908 n=2 Tax=melanogaster subgroup TaxID=32351 RepID=B4Q7D3_DROSI|nr:uncharacterized protein LOC6614390 [Drosophila sechellia]XP_002079646.1 uncharacterized protein LOC6732527 [Drosophila simulans]EDW55473.1 GM17171 [Drosophila sechellia]EDX05231.1 GD21908 [Drosophila simulans]KMY90533.1 uncharacterized protein Dsimw501_GD21908 [Drosophila simulans]
MPNFNGAIIVHTLQFLKAPATLREILVTIAKNTELTQDELKEPVKQTLEMGHRLGFLQKLDGRYFLMNMTFETLMSEMEALDKEESPEKSLKKKKKLIPKTPLSSVAGKKITKKPSQVKTTEQLEKPKPTEKGRLPDIPSSSTNLRKTPSKLTKRTVLK